MLDQESNLIIIIGELQKTHEECESLLSLCNITETPYDEKTISSIVGRSYDFNAIVPKQKILPGFKNFVTEIHS